VAVFNRVEWRFLMQCHLRAQRSRTFNRGLLLCPIHRLRFLWILELFDNSFMIFGTKWWPMTHLCLQRLRSSFTPKHDLVKRANSHLYTMFWCRDIGLAKQLLGYSVWLLWSCLATANDESPKASSHYGCYKTNSHPFVTFRMSWYPYLDFGF